MPRGKSKAGQIIAIGNNPERTRSHNRRVVLESVRRHGPIGRAEIARLTRLTTQAVSNIVAELVAEGFLLEGGRRRIGRGQPPVELVVNPDGGMTAGIEIAAGHLVTVLVDLAGRLRASRTVPVDGTVRRLPAGGLLKLDPGESVTLLPGVWHAFWAEGGDVLIGEVSTVNDDLTDNIFREPIGRFSDIEEDAAPLHLLVCDYERWLR